MGMEFGSFMEFHIRPGKPQAGAFEESFAHVDQAEAQGLDGVWLAETHFNPERAVLSAPLIIASAIAMRTKRMKVGTAVQVLPLGNPLRIAEETATLDQISEGRLEFGVGRSGLPGSYEGYGISYAESRERFYEYLDIIRQAWTQERFTYEGKYFSFHNVCLTPKPYQRPHPMIRVAATTDDTFPKLGEMGLPIFIGLRQVGIPKLEQQVNSYKKAWTDAGHEGEIDVSLRVPVYVGDTASAVGEPENSFMRQFRRLGNQMTSALSRLDEDTRNARAERAEELGAVTWEQVLEEKVAVGTPEMVIDRVQEMKERLSLSGIVAEFNAGEQIPREKVARSLELFCEKVIPAFK
jgi:alkanesulfonate monooxygenase SsuD/methylene tetrahydromethanopterin reductase-like flavin-dependent oxidoreductase (luciferase family)